LRQQLLKQREFALHLGAVLTAQPRDLGEQGLDLLAACLILAIDEEGALS
jgi:hypothetical protein